jgi:uncharacterized RDD family membrane protein YckC
MTASGPVELASFGPRLGGFLLDGLISALLLVPVAIAVIALLAAGPKQTATCTDRFGDDYPCKLPGVGPILLSILIGLLALVAWVWLYQGVYGGKRGATPGKRIVGLRLVDASTGQPIGAWKAIGRYLFASFISGQICYLGYLWVLWDRDRQTWHDKVVSSYVVRSPSR